MSSINFAGLASGIDTNALIDAASAATRKQRVEPKTKKVEELTATNSAFEELKTRLKTLKSLAEGFGTINGGGVAKSATSSNETIATASVVNGATNGNYDISVSALAKAASYSFNYNYTGSSDTLFNAGESGTVQFQIGNSSTETVDVTVTAGMTVAEFVTQFNNNSARAEASVVQIGSGQYRILITTNNTGTDAGAITSSTVSANSRIGTTVGIGANQVTTDSATNATFTMNGIGPFTRQSNKISDVIPGLTFELLSSPGTVKLSVGDDPDASIAALKKFIDAYNQVVLYIEENDQISQENTSGEVQSIFAPFASTRTDNSALTTIRETMSAIRYPDVIPPGQEGLFPVRILADMGIETQRDGTLKFNETTSTSGFSSFRNALSKDPTAVSELTKELGDKLGFTYNAAAGTGIIDSIVGFNRLFDTTVNSNKTLIESLNNQVADAEKSIAQTEANMKAQFARLESLMSKLQQQQSSLTSALSGLR
jgi:flagellar hook-associated protein 2